MEIDSTFYNGNVFIAAASLSYLGPFSGQYRKELETTWISQCSSQDVMISQDYSLIKTLGEPIEIRDWHLAGLPSDQVSTESGIIV
jgi:dynein heavy chain